MFDIDGVSDEKAFIYAKLCEFRVDREDGGKPNFEYRLPTIGAVCREAWILAVGFPNRNNSRVRNLEATIRRGDTLPPPNIDRSKRLTSTDIGKASVVNYILKNSQHSPVTTDLYVTISSVLVFLYTTHCIYVYAVMLSSAA